MIRTENLTKSIATGDGELSILKGINVEIKPGQSVAIVGASGSGKTTLLSLLAGLDLPSSGRVYLDGDDITALSEEQRAVVRGQKVGFVFQSFQLLPSLTALENVMLPLELSGAANAKQRAQQLLERVDLGSRVRHYPRQLSGGEQQRVALSRAFVSEPKILFADEPTGNLDAATGAKVSDLLFELNREIGTTLVLVTHDAQLAQRCQRSVQIAGGEITAEELSVC